MNKQLLINSFMLAFSFLLVFLYVQLQLSDLTVPALGLLIFIYLVGTSKIFQHFSKNKENNLFNADTITVFTLNTAILLLIFSTGGFSSPLFFLLYFLSFGIGFILSPETVFIFGLYVILLFIPSVITHETFNNAIKLGSFLLISPLGYFFGREFRMHHFVEEKLKEKEEKSTVSADTIAQDVEELIENKTDTIEDQELERLDEILEETEELRKS